MRPLKRRERRIAAITLTLLACAMAYLLSVHFWFIAPLAHIADEASTLNVASQQAYALLLRERERQAQLSRAEPPLTPANVLLAGPDGGAGVAQLLQLLSADLQAVTAEGMSCTLTNRTPGVPEQTGEYVQVKVGVGLDCLIEPLAKLIYSLETQRPYLFVESLSIRRISPGEGENHLAVQMSISGYLRGNSPVEAAP